MSNNKPEYLTLEALDYMIERLKSARYGDSTFLCHLIANFYSPAGRASWSKWTWTETSDSFRRFIESLGINGNGAGFGDNKCPEWLKKEGATPNERRLFLMRKLRNEYFPQA